MSELNARLDGDVRQHEMLVEYVVVLDGGRPWGVRLQADNTQLDNSTQSQTDQLQQQQQQQQHVTVAKVTTTSSSSSSSSYGA